jgi:hypothetical protein
MRIFLLFPIVFVITTVFIGCGSSPLGGMTILRIGCIERLAL